MYAVNATDYFSKPGPRTITGLEILAKIINPIQFADLVVPNNSFERMVKLMASIKLELKMSVIFNNLTKVLW